MKAEEDPNVTIMPSALSCIPTEGSGKRRRRHWPETCTTTAESSSAEDDKTETFTCSSTGSTSSADESDYCTDWRRETDSHAATSFFADTGRPGSLWTASRAKTSRFCHWLGYLAGVAGGEIKVFEMSFESTSPKSSSSTFYVMRVWTMKLIYILLNWLLYLVLNASFMTFSVTIFLMLLPLAIIDMLRCHVFWARSLKMSYDHFQERVRARRASLQGLTNEAISATLGAFDCDAARWQRRPWKCSHALSECAFIIYYTCLHIFTHRTLTHLIEDLTKFRQHLTMYPPAFPVRSNDEVFRFDKPGARFNLSMLFVIDRLKFSEICDAFRERLIYWEPKMVSTISYKWGRPCFTPCPTFRIDDHIKERSLDLSKGETAASVMSDFGSAELDPSKPLWQVLVLQPTIPSTVDEAAMRASAFKNNPDYMEANFLPPNREPHEVTYILAKWSHVYADGVGTMTTIVKRLGDYGVDMSGLPEKYRQQVPTWQVVLFWCWHGLVAALQGLRLFLFMSYGLAPYPALIQSNSNFRLPLPHTGHKWYSTPASFQLDEINQLRDVIYKRTRVRPTVNDIFAHCVAASAGRLRSASEVETYLRQHLKMPIRHITRQSTLSREGALRHNCIQSIIPMMCRTSVPQQMDNFTSLVCSRLPLPEHCWRAHRAVDGGVIEELLRVKAEIDFLKGQRLRTTGFLVMTFLFKCLPIEWARSLYECAYRSMQLCSTNVAAPGIESKFFGKEVHGLYFWPAVPATGTVGTSLVSLGNHLQFLTIIEECELLPGVDLAEQIYAIEGVPFGMEEQRTVIKLLSECWRRMVAEEYTKLKLLLLTPDTGEVLTDTNDVQRKLNKQ